MEKIRKLISKYWEIITYIIFGVLTTVVNVVVYWLFAEVWHIPNMVSWAVAWIASVAFAYVTNRKWVFDSKAKGFKEISAEIVKFVGARVFSGGVDALIMWVAVDLLSMNNMVWKIIANIVVIIMNYVLSKLIVFKKKVSDKKKSDA
ncbi:MAG: GtrA family protein [Candidatus Saccharibacteria bacterium]|nr:GtrA family protein [Candidatus Saccharibacteria bacterium]